MNAATGEALIRRATAADLDTLLPLIREFYTVDRHSFDEAKVRRALAPLLAADTYGVVWLIGEPASGYAVVTWSYSLESGGRDALLDEIYVSRRGLGLGTRALRAILADLPGRGLTRIFLETESHNRDVRRFYARLGFRQEDSVWMVNDLEA
jgi:ribosomal protein S18 acetylase RimI-like enzyme